MKKVICFDFDDVIVDGNAFNVFRKINGYNSKEVRLLVHFLENNRKPKEFSQTLHEFLKFAKGTDFKIFEKSYFSLKLTRGTKDALKKLKKKNYKIVIISANDKNLVREFCRKKHIDRYFDHIYASRFGVKKGIMDGTISGEVIETEKLGVIPRINKIYRSKSSDIVYVGDGMTDIPIMKKTGKSILFCPNFLTKIEIFRDNKILEKDKKGQFFLVEKKDLSEIVKFIS